MQRSKESLEDWQRNHIKEGIAAADNGEFYTSEEANKVLEDWQLKEIEEGMKDAREGRVRTTDQLLTDLGISQANQPSGASGKKYEVYIYSPENGYLPIGNVDSIDKAIQYVKEKEPNPIHRQEILLKDPEDVNLASYHMATIFDTTTDEYTQFYYEAGEE